VAPADFVEYRVTYHDTLYGISQRLLGSPAHWPTLARLNRVRAAQYLRPGTMLRLPMALLPWRGGSARVLNLLGSARSIGAQGIGDSEEVSAGSVLTEGQGIQVSAAGMATLELQPGGHLLRLEGGSRLMLQELRGYPTVGVQRASLQQEAGRVESEVKPRGLGSRFDVRTPLAVAGVRGTRFGVALTSDGRMLADVVEGHVGLQPTGDTHRSGTAGPTLEAGQAGLVTPGLAGSADIAVRQLLPAPDLHGLPARFERPVFSISAPEVPGAAGYKITIARDEHFVQVLRHVPQSALPARFAGLDDGDYHVAMRAVDAEGVPGAETVALVRLRARPEPPLLRDPAPAAVLPLPAATLSCADVLDAVAYDFQLTPASDFTPETTRTQRMPRCSWAPEGLAPGTYKWRVATVMKGTDGHERIGPYGDPATFRMAARPTPPQANADPHAPGSVHWGGEPGMRYLVQLASTPGFDRDVRTLETMQPRMTLPLQPCRPLFLRLQAVDDAGLESGYSAPQRIDPPPAVCTGIGDAVETTTGAVLSGTQ
jgi:hypothetical protein